MDCGRSLEPPRRSPDGDVVSDGAPGLCFGAERGENMYIYPCFRLNILSQLFFPGIQTTLLQPRSTTSADHFRTVHSVISVNACYI